MSSYLHGKKLKHNYFKHINRNESKSCEREIYEEKKFYNELSSTFVMLWSFFNLSKFAIIK